ncbi:MAG TPA: sugar phosphate nucleotidyltransferase [Kofleriaceae bacterium]|nr:sugar phosphate nucleotidyltransferase [Kofleriaceae bacterium]
MQSDSPTLDWTLVLAGGEGTRLAEYVERRFGHRIPKQFCRLLGSRSMLEHTLDRLNRLTPAARTLAVIGTDQAALAMPQLAGRCDHVFRQPAARDTGIALYVALAMVLRWTPNAIVAITPADHYVAPADAYVEQVRRARSIAARRRDTVVLLGARPTEPDPDLGYLAIGGPIASLPGALAVDAFVEKPAVTRASALIRGGALWNTMVMCATASTLWELGRAVEPGLFDLLEALIPLVGTRHEDTALAHVYRTAGALGFSRGVLERSPARLVAVALDGVEWSDWGRPERVETTLALRRSRALVSDASALVA